MIWGGVGFWRSLMRLDLIDEFRLDVHPYVAGEGTQMFSNGIVGLQYRRPR